MHKLLLSFLIPVPLLLSSQTDTWEAVETTGFGSAQNYDVIEFAVFKDTLYATMGRTGTGAAEIWRSGTGDAGSWEKVIYDSGTNSVKGVPSINTTHLDGGIMWISTGNPIEGTQVYRSTNGTDWTAISHKGFGSASYLTPAPNMVVYDGYLYAGAGSHQAATAWAQVWRTPYTNTDPNNWELIMDFAKIDSACTQITYFYEWNGKLYVGANGDSILYESSDGVNFVANEGVGTDFGQPGNLLIAALIEHDGKLFAATNNRVKGGNIFSTKDGNNWTTVNTDGLGFGPIAEELHHLDTSFGRLWVTAYTDTAISNGIPVWSSIDGGLTFPQSNINGFGNENIDGENAITIGFKGRQYCGGPNYIDGGQIWRTQNLVAVNNYAKSDCAVGIYPNPGHNFFNLSFNGECEKVREISVIDVMGKVVTEYKNQGNKASLDLSELPAGMYYINLISDQIISFKSIVKQ